MTELYCLPLSETTPLYYIRLTSVSPLAASDESLIGEPCRPPSTAKSLSPLTASNLEQSSRFIFAANDSD